MPYIDERQTLIKLCYVIAMIVSGLILTPFFFRELELSRSSLELFTLFNWLILSTILIYALPKGIWSISFIFFSVFSIFHGGLIFVSALDMITDRDILKVIKYWFHNAETIQAIYLVNFTLTIYAIVVVVFSKSVTHAKEIYNTQLIKRFHHIGGLILILMVLTFLIVSVYTGASNSYTAYLAIVSNSPVYNFIFVYIYLFIGMAIVFVAVSYRHGFGYQYFIIFAIWGTIAFKMGLRGEVLFPASVAAAMLGRRRVPIKALKLAVIVMGLLIATVIVKNARLSGDYSNIDNMNPLNAVAEMGSSLRTIQEVIKWNNQGFIRLNGASYWAPFERQLALFLPIKKLPAKKDKRLLNVVVQEKAGPIGFSPIAEAYVNFGEKGIILLAIVLGLALAKLDAIPSTIRSDVLIGVAIVPLFIMIRNSFTFIPVQMFIGITIALIILQLAKIKWEK